MYRLVVSDMDETFLDANHAIPPANLRALRRMRELGVLFVPSSGRWYSSIMDNFTGEARELIEGGYVLSYNGGFINRTGDPTPLTTCGLSGECANAIYAKGLDLGLCMHINVADGHVFVGFINRTGDPTPLTTCGLSGECANAIYAKGLDLGLCMHINVADGHVFVNDAPARERDYLKSITGVTHFRGSDHPDLSFLEERGIVKILYVDWDFDALQELGHELAPMAGRLGVEITFSSRRYLEFMPAGVDKGTGLVRLAKMLDIPMSQVIAVGDSANDLPMIKAAGLGIGVANATDDVRPYCDVVLETAGADGAFNELVERFLEP